MQLSDTMQRMLSLAGLWVLAAIALAGLLYGLYLLLGGPQARVRARVKRFVINQDLAQIDEADVRARQRATLARDNAAARPVMPNRS